MDAARQSIPELLAGGRRAWPAACQLVAAAAAVDQAAGERLRALAASHPDWEQVLAEADHHSLAPLLLQQLRQHAADLAPDWLFERLRQASRRLVMRNLFLCSEMAQIMLAFQRAEIRALTFKGPTLAVLAYGAPSLRWFVDVDVLIARADFPRARQVLAALEYLPRYPLTAEQEQFEIDRHCQLTFDRDRGGAGGQLDLHTSLSDEVFSVPLEMDELWERRAQVYVEGVPYDTLSPSDLCLYLSIHGARHMWLSMAWIGDFARMMLAGPGVDWNRVWRRAQSAGCGTVLLLGARVAESVLRAPLAECLSAALASNPHIERLAEEVRDQLCGSPERPGQAAFVRFYWRCQPKPLRIVRWLAAICFLPHVTDWQWLALPRPWWFLYALLRPARLLAVRLRRLAGR